MVSEQFTDTEKMDEAARELAMRVRYYPGMVERGVGGLTHQLAEYRTKVMQEIANDYKQRVEQQAQQLKLDV